MKNTIEVKTVDGFYCTIFKNQIVAIINREGMEGYEYNTAIYTTTEKMIVRTNLKYKEVLALLD